MKHLELFDYAGVDLRPEIRQVRDSKKRAVLQKDPIIHMTLNEYCEYMICGKPVEELTEHEIRGLGASILTHERGKHYFHLDYDDPIDDLKKRIIDAIQDKIDLYHETGGMYGKNGKLLYNRRIEQAKRLGVV